MQAMDLGLSGKIAVVTGSSRGLGLASASAGGRGCHVVLCARRAPGSTRPCTYGRDGAPPARLHAVEADVSTSAACGRHRRGRRDFGGIDILVNNVGSSMGTDLLGTGDEVWHRRSTEPVPVDSRVAAGRAVHGAARRRRHHHHRVDLRREAGGRMTYNVVKAAEISLAKSLAQQLAPSNIRVNSVSPDRSRSRAAPGGSGSRRTRRHGRVRQARDPDGPVSDAPRKWGTWWRSSPAPAQLDQRHVDRRRRLSEPGVLPIVEAGLQPACRRT
jgi:3-oxoacyl-[acyl-carrier protein] reductase